MPNGESNVMQSFLSILPVGLISILGGFLDYFYAVQTKKRVWSLASFVFHLAFSFFVGYIAALALVGMGYGVEIAGAAAGAAGFLNIRLIDLVIFYIKKRASNDD